MIPETTGDTTGSRSGQANFRLIATGARRLAR